MKKILILFFMLLLIGYTAAQSAGPSLSPGGMIGARQPVIFSTDCSTYIQLGLLCQNTSTGTLYVGDGASAVQLATGGAVPSASTTTPSMDGSANYGTGTTWARGDHVHPSDTARQAASALLGDIANISMQKGYLLWYNGANLVALPPGTINYIFGMGANTTPGYPWLFNPSTALGSSTSTIPSESVVTTALAAKAPANPTEYDNSTCTTAMAISAANGSRQKVTLTNGDTCAFTFTQPSSGTMTILLKIIQSASSTYNGTISGGKWPGGSPPTITATTGAVDIISCYLDGANAYCIPSQDFK